VKSIRVGTTLTAAAVVTGMLAGAAPAKATTVYEQATSASQGVVTQTPADGQIPFNRDTGRKVH